MGGVERGSFEDEVASSLLFSGKEVLRKKSSL